MSHFSSTQARTWRQQSINSKPKEVCVWDSETEVRVGLSVREEMSEIEMSESCLWEQDDPCDSACPSLCFPHSLTWLELYPHHHIHKGLCLQTSPYLWFIVQCRARCLLTVLPAAHGITSAFGVFLFSFYKAAQNMLVSPLFALTLSALTKGSYWCFVTFSGWCGDFIFHSVFYILGS